MYREREEGGRGEEREEMEDREEGRKGYEQQAGDLSPGACEGSKPAAQQTTL